MSAVLVNKEQIAYALGVTTNTINRYQNRDKDPLPVKKKGAGRAGSEYDLQDVIKWHVDEQIRIRVGKPIVDDDGETEFIDKDAQQARLYREQADNMALKNAQMRRELAPIGMLQFVLSKAGSQIRAILEAIALKVKKRVPSLSASEIEIIQKEIVRAMNVISRLNIDIDEYESDPGAEV